MSDMRRGRSWSNGLDEALKNLLLEKKLGRLFENWSLATSCVLGLVLGLSLPTDHLLSPPFDRISAVIGWIYFAAWSVSFYPQVIMNWRRKSVVGLSFDFVALNLLGFACYATYTCAFFWSDEVQAEYAARHHGQRNSVQVNDVFFALHALLLVAWTGVQILVYNRGDQRLSHTAAALMGVIVVLLALGAVCVLWSGGRWLAWLDLLYLLSYVKLGISLCKYIPQVVLNMRRQSTEGWNIWNVLLDFTGGILSVAQVLLDAYLTADWGAVTGNPVKFGLGFVSLAFDSVFMVQHYILYPEDGSKAVALAGYAVLGGEDEEAGPGEVKGKGSGRDL